MKLLCDARGLMGDIDGIGRFSTGIIAGLTRERPGWELSVLCGPGGYRHLAGLNVGCLESSAQRFRRTEEREIGPLIDESGADAYLNLSMAGPRPVIPTIITVHDLMVLNLPGYFGESFLRNVFYRRVFRGLLSRSISHASAIAVPSAASLRELASTFPGSERKAFVSGEGQDLFLGGHLPFSPDSRRDFLLYVGNAKAYKNLTRLVVAYARLRAMNPAFPEMTMVVKKGRAFGSFMRELEDTTASEAVTVLSAVDDSELIRLYSTTMGLIMPSLQEGFGLPALEAMAAGTPVVCSAGTALEELVGESGILVDPSSVTDIMKGMALLVADAELRSKLSTGGLERSKLFTWDRAASAIAKNLEVVTA